MRIINLFIVSLLIFPLAAFGQTRPVKIYLGNEHRNPNMDDCGKVYPVTRSIPQTKAVAAAALAELFKGATPEEQAQGYTAFPAAESAGIFKSVKIKNKAAYVNFRSVITKQFERASTACGNQFVTAQIEATLKQFGVNKVYYAIEGRPCDYYYWLEMSDCPLTPQERRGKNF